MARQFGIITNLEGLQAGIVVNSLTYNESCETAEARNEKRTNYRFGKLLTFNIIEHLWVA